MKNGFYKPSKEEIEALEDGDVYFDTYSPHRETYLSINRERYERLMEELKKNEN